MLLVDDLKSCLELLPPFSEGEAYLDVKDSWHVCVDLAAGSFVPNDVTIGVFLFCAPFLAAVSKPPVFL